MDMIQQTCAWFLQNTSSPTRGSPCSTGAEQSGFGFSIVCCKSAQTVDVSPPKDSGNRLRVWGLNVISPKANAPAGNLPMRARVDAGGGAARESLWEARWPALPRRSWKVGSARGCLGLGLAREKLINPQCKHGA